MCVQGMPLSSCLVLPASHARALMFVTLQYFVSVPSLLFQVDSVGFLGSKVLHASFSAVCNFPGYYAEF
jgi:hypothetical protein